jgi:hypothetical protein
MYYTALIGFPYNHMIWIRYYDITEYDMVFDRCCSLSKLQGPKDQDVQETFKVQQKCCSEKQDLYFFIFEENSILYK